VKKYKEKTKSEYKIKRIIALLINYFSQNWENFFCKNMKDSEIKNSSI